MELNYTAAAIDTGSISEPREAAGWFFIWFLGVRVAIEPHLEGRRFLALTNDEMYTIKQITYFANTCLVVHYN